MKKSKIMTVLSLVLAAALTACSSTNGSTASKTSGSQAAASTTSSSGTTSTTSKTSTASTTSSASVSNSGATKIDLSAITGEGDRLDKIIEAGVITCATSPDFAPSEFVDLSSGEAKYVGSDMDLAQYIADALGVKLEIKPMKFDAIKAAVTTGQVDMAISGLAYSEERAQNMQLSDFFNLSDGKGQGIVIHKDDAAVLNSAEAFAGKTVMAQNGSIQVDLTKEQLPEANVKLITDINNGVMDLLTKKADGLTLDIGVAEMIVTSQKDLVISDFKFDYTSEGNVIACTKGETKLVNAINAVLKEVNEKGLYQEWKEAAIELAKSLGVEVNE